MFTAGYLFKFNYILGENRKALPNEALNPVGLLLQLIIITRQKAEVSGSLLVVCDDVCVYVLVSPTMWMCNQSIISIHVYNTKSRPDCIHLYLM